MRTRPILFNGAMVQAILEGRKTQTRRELKVQPQQSEFEPSILHFSGLTKKRQIIGGKVIPKGEYWSGSSTVESYAKACPFGQVGDQLWVRETFCPIYPQDPTYNNGEPIEYDYAATYKHGYRLGDNLGIKKKWIPSIHMPRKASRIQLEITGVRVERLNEISERDAKAEGIEPNWIGDLNKGPNGFGGQGWTPENGWIHYLHSVDGEEAYTPVESYQSLWESINGAGSWNANPWVWVIEFEVVK